jgi:hypothetical protein
MLLLACSALWYYVVLPGQFGKPQLYLTGVVLDAHTHQPLEDVYVLATYHDPIPDSFSMNWAHVNAREPACTHTRGMFTGKDGGFRLPVEKYDGLSPWRTYAIKADYYTHLNATSTMSIREHSEIYYRGRDIYLKRQDPSKPNTNYGPHSCGYQSSPVALAALVEFSEIELQETRKYFPDISTDSMRESINRMKDPNYEVPQPRLQAKGVVTPRPPAVEGKIKSGNDDGKSPVQYSILGNSEGNLVVLPSAPPSEKEKVKLSQPIAGSTNTDRRFGER